MKAYPVYQDSGIPWLGMIPESWNIIRLRNLLHKTTQKDRPDLPLLSVVRELGVILRDVESKEENHNFIPDDLSNYKVLLDGQFVINKMKSMARFLRNFLFNRNRKSCLFYLQCRL